MAIKLQSVQFVKFKVLIPSKDVLSVMKSIIYILESTKKDALSVLLGMGHKESLTLCRLRAFSVKTLCRRGTYIERKAKCDARIAMLLDRFKHL